MFRRLRSQEEIFASFDWWNKGCLLNQTIKERCGYIESCITTTFGKGAFEQQEILEVGCGGGLICEELARRGAVSLVGIDSSKNALEVARIHSQQSGLGQKVYYQQGYAESLPYTDGSFSVIICFDTLEHVRDLNASIKEIARVLAPGGIFIFDTINRTLIARVILIWYGEHFLRSSLPPGIHSYNKFIKPRELQALLIENGLQIREITGFMPRRFTNGRFEMGTGWFIGVSYVGYATKFR